MYTQSDRNLTIEKLTSDKSSRTQGFFVKSTATINVEDQPIKVETTFNEIKDEVVQTLLESSDPQINIYVHGYSVKHSLAEARTRELFKTAQSRPHPGQLVLGFLWPSENPVQDNSQIQTDSPVKPPKSLVQKVRYALESLPTVLLIAFSSSLILGLTAWGLMLAPVMAFSVLNAGLIGGIVGLSSIGILALSKAMPLSYFAVIHALSAVAIFWLTQFSEGRVMALILSDVLALLCGMLAGLIILRLITYLRDRERASYFAVYDLVELIRKLDKAVWEAGKEHDRATDDWKLRSELKQGIQGRPRVELNIMAHSLGCMVVTNAIRILSDVFDPAAVEKEPDSKLGKTLSLERLVLIAPDIPIEAVLPGRSNFLTSTLKRCCEPYIFSNEGDLALRLASTAANYISYFSRERFGGYRLGNITCQRPPQPVTYGIINQRPEPPPHQYLDVRSSNREKKSLLKLYEDRNYGKPDSWNDAIADKITYFDCTDYLEAKRPMLTGAKKLRVLNFIDYCGLVVTYLITKTVDPHGGYFEGQLSRELIHELILSGFQEYLEGHHQGNIPIFNQVLEDRQIQMVMSHPLSQKFF